jgi:pyruvate kinase
MELMLLCYQGESAVGEYPIESVSTMNSIIENVEKDKNNFNLEIENNESLKTIDDTDAITSAAYSIANNAGAKAIITFSVSGKTTLRMARERAPVQIIGLSPNIRTGKKNANCLGSKFMSLHSRCS